MWGTKPQNQKLETGDDCDITFLSLANEFAKKMLQKCVVYKLRF